MKTEELLKYLRENFKETKFKQYVMNKCFEIITFTGTYYFKEK